MHGDKSQGQRERALARFERGDVEVLVATDVAARGIDVADIAHVINFDAPGDRDSYVHRVGRTGRAGARGAGTSFVLTDQAAEMRRIARDLGLLRGVRAEPRPRVARPDQDSHRGQSAAETALAAPAAQPPAARCRMSPSSEHGQEVDLRGLRRQRRQHRRRARAAAAVPGSARPRALLPGLPARARRRGGARGGCPATAPSPRGRNCAARP